ncbi:MAG: VWA domain-containing protein, partial [Bacteroidota bacterium]
MKKTAVLLLTFLLCVYAIAQEDDFVYTITVIGNKGNTQSGIKVWMNNKATGKTIVKRTGSDGIVRFGLGEGTWTVNLPGLPNYREIDIKEGRKGQGSVMFSYDYDEIMKEQKIINDRKNIQFTTVDQGKMNITGPTQGNCVIKVHLTDASEEPVKGLNVDLISTKQAKIYHSETDQSGNATFLVPIGEIYAVDVENIRNFTFTGNVFRPGVLTIDDTFEPSVFKEINRNDTIVQMLAADEEASTSHVHVLMYVVDESLQPLAGETVYMQQLTTNVVYKGTSDENGQVVFMLPKGEKYMLHFDYQKDVDVYNYTKVVGRGNTEATVIYNPDPRLKYPENFIPKPDELFIEEFENFITKALPEPENDKKVDVFFEWGNAGVNASSKEAVLNIGVSGSNDERKFENVPYVDIAFVIDKSGSMYGHDRIEALKETMVEFTGKLRPDDYVCLVTFDTDAYIDIQLGRRGTGSELKRIISEIEPGGGTNIYNGMVLGYEQLLKSRNTDRAKQLILLTDGYGETEPAIVVEKSKEYNDKGLNISAIGVGEDYNYALLSLLTQNQGGLLSHAGESKDIYKAFETQLSGL